MSKKRSSTDSTGAVSLEFLIAFPLLWTFCLCIFQLVLLARADLVVRHATEAAARSASVVLADDPARYEGEPEMSVSRESPDGLGWRTSEPVGSLHGTVLELALRTISLDGRSRRETIAAAARVPLIPLGAPPRARATSLTVHSAIGPSRVAEALVSNLGAFQLSFPEAEQGEVQGPEVTVRVVLAYRCYVPIARHIICDRGTDATTAGTRVWRIDHSTTLLVHDAPYSYRIAGDA